MRTHTCRFRFLGALALATGVFGAGRAEAQDPPHPGLRLTRSPILLSAGMPDEVRCVYDEDGNGLDDQVEQGIAQRFVPEFRFDEDEPGSSLLANEPRAVFSILRKGDTLTVRYVFLWKRDAGFVNDAACWSGHLGDTQAMDMTVRLTRSGHFWYAEMLGLEGFTDTGGTVFVGGSPALEIAMNGRPVVYSSAGKHHFYTAPGSYKYGGNYLNECDDTARGTGPVRIPTVAHGPFVLARPPDPLGGDFLVFPTLVDSGGVFGNLCSHIEGGSKPSGGQPWSLRNNQLDDWGYGDALMTDLHFLSEDADGVVQKLAWWGDWPDNLADGYDGDEDGIADRLESCPSPDPNKVPVPGEEDDLDGDGLTESCDPTPRLKNRYVAGGSASLPTSPFNWHPWYPPGFLDTDTDELIDGADLCPVSPGGGDDRNRWGEEENLGELGSDDREGGSYRRGDRCDPYPATTTRWLTDSSATVAEVKCEHSGNATVGADSLKIEATVSAGVSDNDPVRDQQVWSVPSRTFNVQTFRCACRQGEGKACLDDPLSDCYRRDVREPGPGIDKWRGWRPVERPGCPHNSEGFCKPYQLSVPVSKESTHVLEWNWLAERPLPEHYAPGAEDIETTSKPVLVDPPFTTEQQSYLQSTHEYALWTQTLEGESFDKAPGPQPFGQGSHSNLHRDPEELDSALLNITSTHSRRLRASHTLGQQLVQEHLEAQMKLAIPCPTLPAGWSSGEMVRAYWRSKLFGQPSFPGLTPVPIPGRPEPPKPWLLVQSSSRKLDSLRILPQGDDSWSAFSPSGLSTSDTWVLDSPGMAALVDPAQATGVAQRPAGTPGIMVLWVQRSAASPRWTLFATEAASEGAIPLWTQVTGMLKQSTEGSVLVPDELGGVAALLDPATGALRAFDASLARWFSSEAVLQPIAGRQDTAVVLAGSRLFVLGGTDGGGVHGDGIMADVFGGAIEPLGGLPARAGARAALSNDQRAILLYGGTDANGVVHDDVWALPMGPERSGGARLLRSDTPAAGSVDAAHAVIASSSSGSGLVRVRETDPSTTEVVVELRTEQGWEAIDESGQVAPSTCGEQDLRGGELCLSGDTDWWSSPALRPCSQQGQAAACPGSLGKLARSWSIPGASVAAAPEFDGAWVLRGGALERWASDALGQRLLAQRQIGSGVRSRFASRLSLFGRNSSRAYDVAMGDGSGLVLSDAGAQVFSPTKEGFVLGRALPLCGTPVRVAYMGEQRFAVSTTAGVAVVEAAEGDRAELKAMAVFEPGDDARPMTTLEVSATSIAQCTSRAPRLRADQLAAIAQAMPVGALGPMRVILARGGTVYDLGFTDGSLWLSGKPIQSPGLEALRGDAGTSRVYGVARVHGSMSLPVFDARGDGVLQPSGTHDMEDWVTRSDRGAFSVRVDNGRARVAEVVR